MKILCGTDFSAAAAQAATEAAHLARLHGEPLQLVHVRPPISFRESLSPDLTAWHDTIRTQLEQEAARLRALGAAVETTILVGRPDEELMEQARRHDARIIVVGALGSRSPLEWLIGSTAERTAAASPVPVLVVRGGGDASGVLTGPIVVGVDFTAAGKAAVEWAQAHAALGERRVQAIHLYSLADMAKRFGLASDDGTARGQIETLLRRDLAALVGDAAAADCELRPLTAAGRTAADLLQRSTELGATLLVLGSHERDAIDRLLLGGVAHSLLARAPISVACVPAVPVAIAQAHLPRLRTILVATDLTPAGNEAIPYAYSLARPGARVHLLHVVAPSPAAPLDPQHIAALEADLRQLIPHESTASGVATEVVVAQDKNPAARICIVADQIGADAICMATHERTEFVEAVASSITLDVIRHSERPLLVVHPKAQ